METRKTFVLAVLGVAALATTAFAASVTDGLPPKAADRLESIAAERGVDISDRGNGGATFPRAAGISVTVRQVDGPRVDFDVTLTTAQTSPSYYAWNPGRLGRTSFQTATSTAYTATFGYVLGRGLGGGNYGPYTYLYFDTRVGGVVTYHTLTVPSLGGSSQVVQVQRSDVISITFDGGVPAIEYGDGSSLNTATLGLTGSTTTTGGGVRRVFRGSFSHVYDVQGIVTIRAASPPIPLSVVSPGTTVNSYSYPFEGRIAVLTDRAFDSFNFTDYQTIVPLTSGGSPVGTGTVTTTVTNTGSGSLRSGVNLPFSTYNTTPTYADPAQAVATAQVDLRNVLEVPTTSTWGLLALGGLLAAAGIGLLRR